MTEKDGTYVYVLKSFNLVKTAEVKPLLFLYQILHYRFIFQ